MKNKGITFTEVRHEAMETIRQLKAGTLDVKTAAEVRNLLDTIIDTGKTQVEFLKAIPNSVKESMTQDQVQAMAGTLRDRDAELDETLKQIEENQHKTYEIAKEM